VQKDLAEYSLKVKKDYGREFQMRIGLNSGPVVVGSIGDDLHMDYMAIGDTINLASRMEGRDIGKALRVYKHCCGLRVAG
jgi:class 3 adenylate cyclase